MGSNMAKMRLTKNPKSIIRDILVIFNSYIDIKGSFCREFEYLQYFLYNYRKIYIVWVKMFKSKKIEFSTILLGMTRFGQKKFSTNFFLL